MKVKACGYYILIEIPEVKTSNGIIIPDSVQEGEATASDTGYIRGIGPTAFSGMEAIKGKTGAERAKEWGVEVGDKVEFTRYDGKKLSTPGYENYRLILDQHIISKVED